LFVDFFISLSTLFVCWFLYIFKHLVCFREMITATSSTSNEIAVLGKHFGIRRSQISVLLPYKTTFEIVKSQTDTDNSSNTIQLFLI
jgi:hypothetical protein